MSDVGFKLQRKYDFPLTEFIVALHKMTPEQKLQASAERAAQRYGLQVDRCQWWITQAQRAEQWPVLHAKRRENGRMARLYRKRYEEEVNR